MDQVLGNEHSTNPSILIAPILENPIIENTSQTSATEPTTESLGDDEDNGYKDLHVQRLVQGLLCMHRSHCDFFYVFL